MKNTRIEWVDHTWSPWIGCTKKSAGCAHCYAEHLMDTRMKRVTWGSGNPRSRTSEAYWKEPIAWQDFDLQCPKCGARYADPDILPMPYTCPTCDTVEVLRQSTPSVFPSLCDWLDPEVPIEWLSDFFALIQSTPKLRWLLLTKRPEEFWKRLEGVYQHWLYGVPEWGGQTALTRRTWILSWRGGAYPANVAIGVSAENQEMWDERVPRLIQIPARWRFVSVEPMLGPIVMNRPVTPEGWQASANGLSRIHQVIFGGESGPNARPCNVAWIRSGVRQCREAGVPAFVKQLGACVVDRNDAGYEGDSGPASWPMDTDTVDDVEPGVYQGKMVRVRLKNPSGGNMAEWPEGLRVRERL